MNKHLIVVKNGTSDYYSVKLVSDGEVKSLFEIQSNKHDSIEKIISFIDRLNKLHMYKPVVDKDSKISNLLVYSMLEEYTYKAVNILSAVQKSTNDRRFIVLAEKSETAKLIELVTKDDKVYKSVLSLDISGSNNIDNAKQTFNLFFNI